MAAGRFVVPPYFPARNRDFDLLSGAKLYVYDNLTTDKANIYTDEALTVLSANPVIANSSGQFPAIWAQAGTEAEPVLYSVSVTTSTGASPGNPFNFDNYRPSVDWETAAAALAEAAAALAVAEAAAAAVSADEAAADAVLTAADLAAIEAIIADAPDAPSVLNKLNRDGDNAEAGLLEAIGDQTPDLTALTAPIVDSDILTGYRAGLRRFTASVFADYIKAFFSASGGSALVGFLQAGTGAVLRTLQAKNRDIVSVKDFGAVGDGTTDDTAAIQAAITSLVATGGTVFFPTPARYLVTEQIEISSQYPIVLRSTMQGWGQLTPFGSFIKIGAPISGDVFKWFSPTGNRGDAGGGGAIGIAVRDTTNPNNSNPGTNTVNAVFGCVDMNQSVFRDCLVHYVAGSAFRTEFCVMTTIDNPVIRYCGRTGFPAMDICPDGDVTYASQSLDIISPRMEVCAAEPYMRVGEFALEVKVIGGGFEADPDNAAGSVQKFIEDHGEDTSVVGTHFNRNGAAVQVDLTSDSRRAVLSAVRFRGENNSTTALVCGGGGGKVDATFNDGKTAYSVVCTGSGYDLNLSMRVAGAIDLGVNNTAIINYNTVTTNNAYAVEIKDNSSAFVKLIGGGAGSGGVKLTGTTPTLVTGSTVKDLSGIGIRIESENAIVQGCAAYQTTAVAISVASGVLPTQVYGNWTDDGSDLDYLTGTLTYDPGSMGPGAIVGPVSVTVPGARQGDLALVSFNNYNTANIVFSGFISGNNAAIVWLKNMSATDTDDLGSGTITVRAIKV